MFIYTKKVFFHPQENILSRRTKKLLIARTILKNHKVKFRNINAYKEINFQYKRKADHRDTLVKERGITILTRHVTLFLLNSWLL